MIAENSGGGCVVVKKRKDHSQEPGQLYDSTLKELVQSQAGEIVPLLLPGAIYKATLDIERIRPTLRSDRVYKIFYKGQEHVLDLEFESGSDKDMPVRLLTYHALLYQEYGLPVISLIIYPFRATLAKSPWQEMSGEEELLTFHFLVLPLFLLKAEYYVQEHVVSMYPLLPVMQGVTSELLSKAMDELAEMYHNDEVRLSKQFVWMELLLERTDTISSPEKIEVKRRLHMYDSLWEDHPKVQQIRADSELRGLRRAFMGLVKFSFPELEVLAQQRVMQIHDPAVLDLLIEKVHSAPNQDAVRWLLEEKNV